MKILSRCLVLGLLPLCFAGRWAGAAGVTTWLSKTEVSWGESVQLTLEYQGLPAQAPDLSPLQQDFEIVNRRVTQRVSVVNGQRSQRGGVTLDLLPKRTGVLEIPAIAFGDHWSRAQTLEVGESSVVPRVGFGERPDAAPRFHVEVDARPRQPKVLEQVLLIVRVQGTSPLPAGRLSAPQLSGVAARLVALGENRYPLQRDGQTLSVYEQRYALFPQQSGTLSIAPILAETERSGARGGWPEPGYGLGPLTSPNPPHDADRVRSEPLELNVAPAPRDPEAGPWLPARSLRLTEAWPDGREFEAGQPIVRTLTVEADGLTASLLPPLEIAVPSGMRQYAEHPYLRDQPAREGVLGSRRERLTLVAAAPGVYRLAGIEIDWWNTASHRWERASLPARKIVVSPPGLGPHSLTSRPATAARSSASSEGFAMPRLDAGQPWDQAPEPRYDHAPLAQPAQPSGGPSPRYWPWLVALLGLGWLATLVVWLSGRRRKAASPPPPAPDAQAPTSACQESEWIGALEKSYHASDAGAARSALLGWARSMWPENPPSNLSRLAQRCPEPLRQEVIRLDNALYSPKPHVWNERPVWDWVRAFESQQAVESRPRTH